MNPFAFLFKTRISRSAFLIASGTIWLALILAKLGGFDGQYAGWFTALAATLLLGLLCRSRLHDTGRSGWWLLVILIPIAGAIWLVWRLVFKAGEAHENKWGPSMKAVKDFLKVA